MANDESGSIRPVSRSNFQKVTIPLYSDSYSLMGAYSQPWGVAYCPPSMIHSVSGVTIVPPWSLIAIGFLTICLVSKSLRSMTATRAFALSFMKTNSPS